MRQYRTSVVAVMSLLCFGVSCGPPLSGSGGGSPLSAAKLQARGKRSYPQSEKVVFLSTLKAFELMGYHVALANPETGTIRTGHGTPRPTGYGMATLTWRVSITRNDETGQTELLARPTSHINMRENTSPFSAEGIDPVFTKLWQEISGMIIEVDAVTKSKASEKASGTCFVTASGKIVTAFHVVEDRPSLSVQFSDKSIFDAKLIHSSKEFDLAILETKKDDQPGIPIVSSDSAKIGDRSFTIGFPTPDLLGWEPKFTDGAISATSVGGDKNHFQISVPVQPGNSGGPLLSESGDLIGVIVAKMDSSSFDNVGFAVTSIRLLELLGEDPATPRKKVRKDVVSKVAEGVCRIVASASEDKTDLKPEQPSEPEKAKEASEEWPN